MSGAGGAGAVNETCRALRRDMASAAALGGGRVYGRVFDARAEIQFESFPCDRLCMECRRLEAPTHGDPLRTDPTAPLGVPCPHCGAAAWLDLRRTDAPEEVDAVDAHDTREESLVGSAFSKVVIALVAAGFLAALAYFVPTTGRAGRDLLGHAPFFLMLLCLFGVVFTMVAPGRSIPVDNRVNPSRWRAASPVAPKDTRRPAKGSVEGTHELVAPLSGRRCLAYEVAVRADDDREASPESWALVEQVSAELSVDGIRVGADQAYLQLRRERLGSSQLTEAGERFLRSRGLDPLRSRVICETVVEAGDRVTLHAATSTACAKLVS